MIAFQKFIPFVCMFFVGLSIILLLHLILEKKE